MILPKSMNVLSLSLRYLLRRFAADFSRSSIVILECWRYVGDCYFHCVAVVESLHPQLVTMRPRIADGCVRLRGLWVQLHHGFRHRMFRGPLVLHWERRSAWMMLMSLRHCCHYVVKPCLCALDSIPLLGSFVFLRLFGYGGE